MYDLSQTQWAYLAALIDGEGAIKIGTTGKKSRLRLAVSIDMSTPEPLCTVGDWLGRSAQIYRQPRPYQDRRRWRIALSGTQAGHFLRGCLPYLLLKRDQAEIALQFEHVREAAREVCSWRFSVEVDRQQADLKARLRAIPGRRANGRAVGGV